MIKYRTFDSAFTKPMSLELLNDFGNEGWKLVSVLPITLDNGQVDYCTDKWIPEPETYFHYIFMKEE